MFIRSKPVNHLNNPMFIIGLLFFVFGFITWLGSVLIPYLKIACELNNFQSYFVAFSFYISYFIMAIPSAWVLKKTGYKKGMSLGLLIMSIGTFLFIPAAYSREYGLFLGGLFVQGTGLAILQTAANPYITILGPKKSAAKRISTMGVCNGIASVTAPLILGAIMLKDADGIKEKIKHLDATSRIAELNELAERVIVPYGIMMAVLFVLSIVIYYSSLPEINTDVEDEETAEANTNKKSVLQFPHLVLGVCTLFLYVGAEVIAGDSIIGYASFHSIPLSAGKFFSSLTLVNMLIGYFIGIICIPKFISQENALRISAVTAVLFTVLALLTNGVVSIIFISLLGLANSLMWPAIWPLAIDGLGAFTKKGSSLLIMAIGGGALLPLLYGRLSDLFNPQHAYLMLVPVYLFILFYSIKGYKIRTK
jgi:FHS family L-fucose permease-like MFS transporter